MQKKPPRSVAAVDLGSNSFHMIVCSLTNGKLQTVDRLKEMVRLADGLDKKMSLTTTPKRGRWLAWNDSGKESAISRTKAFGQWVPTP